MTQNPERSFACERDAGNAHTLASTSVEELGKPRQVRVCLLIYFFRLATISSVANVPTWRVNLISSPLSFPVYLMVIFWP